MQLIEIEKSVYRKRLNIVIASFIASLLTLSLIFGSVLIALFEQTIPAALNGEVQQQSSNFSYNFLGVVLALLACAAILHQLKHRSFFKEIYYVWQLKQIHNKIYRKLKKIKSAANNDDVNAFIILNFYFASRKQVYLLDDNTLTISALNKEIDLLNERINNKNLSIALEQFDQNLLKSY